MTKRNKVIVVIIVLFSTLALFACNGCSSIELKDYSNKVYTHAEFLVAINLSYIDKDTTLNAEEKELRKKACITYLKMIKEATND